MFGSPMPRRDAERCSETPAEMIGVVESPGVGNVRDGPADISGIEEILSAALQSHFQNVARDGQFLIVKRHVQIALGAMRGAGEFRDGKIRIAQMARDVLFHTLAN